MPDIEKGVPAAEWKLSACGRDATISLTQSLRGYVFGAIASSPEAKAMGTAEAIASQLGLAASRLDLGFSEHLRRSAGFLT